MKVRVDELPDSGRVVHFHETEAWFSSRIRSGEDAGEITLARPINVDLEVVPEAEQIKLNGQLQGAVRLRCSRCVQDYVLKLDEPIDLMLLHPLPADTPEEIGLRPEDLDTGFFDGVTIDVDLIVAEQVFLALPQQPLCQPDCQGLCSSCGADLNREACKCEKRETTSAFDVLRTVKLEK
ncbi:MAG: DUF177 domain-containing protein [Deltaproteobacteria bacterium]|nr:MAG: DUF177 domain-containing protein [Deltaproteobacteria bacterium]